MPIRNYGNPVRRRYEHLSNDIPEWAQELQQPLERFTKYENEFRGSFGVVYNGSFESYTGEGVEVAIKTYTEEGEGGEESLLREGELLSRIGHHYNVIHLLGVYLDNEQNGGQFNLVFNDRYLGTLLSRLQWLRRNEEARAEEEEKTEKDVKRLERDVKRTTRQMFMWSYEVAKGMQYLADKRIIVGHLAAEHIHLTENLNCKIGYFGPSFIELGKDHSKKLLKIRNETAPLKYLTPESLEPVFDRETQKYIEGGEITVSFKTDIWQWAIVSWQIFSLGLEPYHDKAWVNGTYDQVMKGMIEEFYNGQRLKRPERCDPVFYDNIMRPCWSRATNTRHEWRFTIELTAMMMEDQEKEQYKELQKEDKTSYKRYKKLVERSQMHRKGFWNGVRNCCYSASCHLC